jgi:type VI secretion system ImpM family protein
VSEVSVGTAASGFYGKLPARGDFVRRGLPDSFVNPWDAWLQTVIACGRAEFSDTWLDSYLTAPIWRFFINGGVLDNDAWLGVIMPSVDNVNRYFPLSLAARANGIDAVSAMSEHGAWFDQAETIVLKALDEDVLSIDEFGGLLDALPPLVGGDVPPPAQAEWSIEGAADLTFSRTITDDQLPGALARELLRQVSPATVAFWTVDDAFRRFHVIDGISQEPNAYQWIFGCRP